jgi:hypothetical protein
MLFAAPQAVEVVEAGDGKHRALGTTTQGATVSQAPPAGPTSESEEGACCRIPQKLQEYKGSDAPENEADRKKHLDSMCILDTVGHFDLSCPSSEASMKNDVACPAGTRKAV